MLQRERKEGVADSLTTGAYLVVLGFAVGLLALIAWALMRLDGTPAAGSRPGRTIPARAEFV